MKKEENKIRKGLKASTIVTLIAVGIIVTTIYLFSVSDVVMKEPIIEETSEQRDSTLIPWTGDADPGDNSGFFYFMIKNHSANPTLEYCNNLTNGTTNSNCYEWSDSGNASCSGETPYGTTFDIIIKVGVTNEDGQWTSNSTWNDGYMWCLATCAGTTPAIGADTNMTEIEIANTSSYRWMHYYLNNAGSGYTVAEGVPFNVTGVKFYVQRIV